MVDVSRQRFTPIDAPIPLEKASILCCDIAKVAPRAAWTRA